MADRILAIKVDVDTDRGTRIGVPALLSLFEEAGVRATFLFSLGPDTTGRAIKRMLRPGFFSKVRRTGVIGMYGVRTLLNGTLLPPPHVGRRNEAVLRAARDLAHDVGIHCYDHIRWQDGLSRMTEQEVLGEFTKARREFERIFQEPATIAGAAGWQANAFSLAAYDAAELLFASDARGTRPFYPRVGTHVYRTLQIPTTLPTLDELLGRKEYPEDNVVAHYLSLLRTDVLNVLTIHAEIEGMKKFPLFKSLLASVSRLRYQIVRLSDYARQVLKNPSAVPVCRLEAGAIDGRSGTLALQQCDR
jgi:peptidoglycan/xylan/chitin deacetylase (PgdA/CDA1 family)